MQTQTITLTELSNAPGTFGLPEEPLALPYVAPSLEPGAYHGVPEKLYHELPYISSSFLKKFKDCPADALMPVEVTDCMRLGSAIHSWILEGQVLFEEQYVTMFESNLNKNTTEYKEKAKKFVSDNSKKTVLPATTSKVPTLDVIKGVHASVQNHPTSKKWLSQEGMTEVTLVWDDPITGLRCKARLDFFTEGLIVDLKKTADVKKFKNALVSFNYDIQAAWYLTGALACGLDAKKFGFIALEAERPYKVASGKLSARWIEAGIKENIRLLGLVKECLEQEFFPAYEIPAHITSLSQINDEEMEIEWDMPSWR